MKITSYLSLFFVSILSIVLLPLSFATTYNGPGNYTLMPGDLVMFDEGYIVKYFNYQENVGYSYKGQQVTGDMATITLFKKSANISVYGDNIYPVNIFSQDKDEIKTFSNGFWFYASPLRSNSQEVKLSVFTGSLSSCVDTDAYTIGNTVQEQSLGKWGRNYYKKGIATENKEDLNGQKETTNEDSCSSNLLTEYYCDNGNLKSETKKCTCADEGSCNKGFFDSISEWLGNTFGSLN
jgi:hypothetical protein